VAPDPRERARAVVERAVLHTPTSTAARALRQQIELGDRAERRHRFRTEFSLDRQDEALQRLPEADRISLLPELVRGALSKAQAARADGDPLLAGYRGLASAHAERWAEELLELAARIPGHPRRGAAEFQASLTLGELALERGQRRAAVDHLRRAGAASPCEELAYGPLDLSLADALLDAGEHEAVIGFLDRLGETSVAYREALRGMATTLRNGYRPSLRLPRVPERSAGP
jgi:tetratricopeptide (TPR) repeat protein